MQSLQEHNCNPGTVYQDCLLCDGGFSILNEMELHEATDSVGRKLMRFRGKLQEADTINKNQRLYTKGILTKNVTRLEEAIDAGGLLGECDHPTDSIIHFANASHKLTKLWWEGNILMGEGAILSTPMGMLLRSLINDGVRVGMSSRGVGNGKVNEEGVLVIGETYKLITFDAVADPSTYQAFQEKITGTRRENVTPPQEKVTADVNNSPKNEATRIDTINDRLIVACLGSIIKQQTDEIKARLN